MGRETPLSRSPSQGPPPNPWRSFCRAQATSSNAGHSSSRCSTATRSYHRSDKAFVEEWDAAVTVYGQVFRNVTIVLTRGSGLLDFTRGQGSAAQASIASSFATHGVGANAKATQTSGMKACRETEGGIKGVKEMSSSGQVLGGAQFDTSFSQKPANEGCPASCDAESASCRGITPVQALSNVLSVYLDGTPDGNGTAQQRVQRG